VSPSIVRFGAALPQRATAGDPIAARDFAQAVEALGYAFLETYDHVVGANRATYPELGGVWAEHPFWEPLVLFGYLAGQTTTLEFVPGVIILSQRQTALVAKQAATVDLLSGGRLRMGVGTGWNPVEFEALGANFHDRGRRSEEQIALLRELWTRELVTFHGQWHTVVDAGINPLPTQRPIPIWIGGSPVAVAERVGRIGDGWIVIPEGPVAAYRAHMERIRAAALAAGRDPDSIGLEAWVSLGGLTPEDWAAQAADWRAMGATHVAVNTEFTSGSHHGVADAATVDAHIRLLEQYRDAVGGFGARDG
jgi:probable F420-dependent oxidoreductase